MSILFVLLSLLAVATSWVITGAVRRYALSRSILDVPCQRSSHAHPTPRGGGLAISAVALGGIALAGALGVLPPRLTIGLVGGGAIIAAVGWIDDRTGLGAGMRLLVHLLGALWFLAFIGGVPRLGIGNMTFDLGVMGFALAAVLMVWFVNLFNFMDGIDGLAAGQATIAGLVGTCLFLLLGHGDLAILALCITSASAGFLIWNWAPAKIFMGDAGSCLLGFLFCALAFASEASNAIPLLAWIVILGAFIFDATATLLRRIVRGERWMEGHRHHAYQRAVQKMGSHARVTSAFLVLGLVLGIIAFWLTLKPEHHLIALGVAMTLLTVAYWAVETVAPMPESGARRHPGRVVTEALSPPPRD